MKPGTRVLARLLKPAAAGSAIVAALMLPQASFAQAYQADVAIDYVNSGMMTQSISSVTRQMATEELFSTPRPKSGSKFLGLGASSTLSPEVQRQVGQIATYSPSSSVSRQLRGELADHLAKRNPSQAADMRNALADDTIWREFSRLIGSFGYSNTNLVDVMTAYYVINWEVVNGQDASNNSSGIKAVHDQLAAAMAGNPQIARLSNTDKQRAAEAMGYMAGVAGGAKNELVRNGDRNGLSQLRNAVHQAVLQQGIDLKRLKLTSQGFVQG